MKIIEETYNWARPLTDRAVTTHLILHHAAAESATAQQIHEEHLKNGWSGIGYHYYVRKDGSIYRGRPENKLGAHCKGMNSCSLGVCFEGNFMTDIMGDAQLGAGRELIADILGRYPGLTTGRHSEYFPTACPGTNFPFDRLVSAAVDADDGRDADSPSAWAKADCAWAAEKGIFKGDGTGFNWHGNVTREELAVILHRLA